MIGGLFYQMTCRCFDPADDVFDAGECADPMRRICQSRPGDAGKEIFCSPGKSDHFMRRRGTKNEDQVVIENELVDLDLNVLRVSSPPDA